MDTNTLILTSLADADSAIGSVADVYFLAGFVAGFVACALGVAIVVALNR